MKFEISNGFMPRGKYDSRGYILGNITASWCKTINTNTDWQVSSSSEKCHAVNN